MEKTAVLLFSIKDLEHMISCIKEGYKEIGYKKFSKEFHGLWNLPSPQVIEDGRKIHSNIQHYFRKIGGAV